MNLGISPQQIVLAFKTIERLNNENKYLKEQIEWFRRQLFGLGLGTASSGARHIVGEEGIRLIETYYAKLLYEIGIVGFIAFMALVTILCILTFKAYLKVKNAALKHWGLCANLAQRNHLGKIQIISHASRQLKENKREGWWIKSHLQHLLDLCI